MKILLINPPHRSIGSRVPREHLPPLGLLSVGGPLIDSGFDVRLLDADFSNMKINEIVSETFNIAPDIIMTGHSGSSSAQPIIDSMTSEIKKVLPESVIILGGVFPTFHWKTILSENENIDCIVLGEGEKISLNLINALKYNVNVNSVKGIAFRDKKKILRTEDEELIENLDEYRIAWELTKPNKYTYWGNRPAAVVQFSRGCPHKCSYCGQTLFWKKFRHRDPVKFAEEIAMLYYKYGTEVINFADENPTSNRESWKKFLETIIELNIPVKLVGSCRAGDIYRDADILHLYKRAGFERFLMGVESYDKQTLSLIKKGSKRSSDIEAIKLLRKHDILSMTTYVTGFRNESIRSLFFGLKQILHYDPDQIQLMYFTPHEWTPIFKSIETENVIQADQRLWDYKHQVLETENLKAWQMILLVKIIEAIIQLRPKAIGRLLFHHDKEIRKAIKWYYKIGRKVWFRELYHFFFKEKRNKDNMQLSGFFHSSEENNTQEKPGFRSIRSIDISINDKNLTSA